MQVTKNCLPKSDSPLNNLLSIIHPISLHWDLGILVFSDLTWDNHYSAIIFKAYISLYFIRHATSNSHSPHTTVSNAKPLNSSYKTSIPTIKPVCLAYNCSHYLYGLNASISPSSLNVSKILPTILTSLIDNSFSSYQTEPKHPLEEN